MCFTLPCNSSHQLGLGDFICEVSTCASHCHVTVCVMQKIFENTWTFFPKKHMRARLYPNNQLRTTSPRSWSLRESSGSKIEQIFI